MKLFIYLFIDEPHILLLPIIGDQINVETAEFRWLTETGLLTQKHRLLRFMCCVV